MSMLDKIQVDADITNIYGVSCSTGIEISSVDHVEVQHVGRKGYIFSLWQFDLCLSLDLLVFHVLFYRETKFMKKILLLS